MMNGGDIAEQKYSCPYCKEKYTEDELWEHCPRYHGNENVKKLCPICVHQYELDVKRGKSKSNPSDPRVKVFHSSPKKSNKTQC